MHVQLAQVQCQYDARKAAMNPDIAATVHAEAFIVGLENPFPKSQLFR